MRAGWRGALERGEVPDAKAPSRIDLNRLLRWMNAVVAMMTAVAYERFGDNEFLDGQAVTLAVILAIQTHVALLVEQRRRDPFVIMLAFILILYYSLRIFTLLVFPFAALDRYRRAPLHAAGPAGRADRARIHAGAVSYGARRAHRLSQRPGRSAVRMEP